MMSAALAWMIVAVVLIVAVSSVIILRMVLDFRLRRAKSLVQEELARIEQAIEALRAEVRQRVESPVLSKGPTGFEPLSPLQGPESTRTE
jgi:hypothetical protein